MFYHFRTARGKAIVNRIVKEDIVIGLGDGCRNDCAFSTYLFNAEKCGQSVFRWIEVNCGVKQPPRPRILLRRISCAVIKDMIDTVHNKNRSTATFISKRFDSKCSFSHVADSDEINAFPVTFAEPTKPSLCVTVQFPRFRVYRPSRTSPECWLAIHVPDFVRWLYSCVPTLSIV